MTLEKITKNIIYQGMQRYKSKTHLLKKFFYLFQMWECKTCFLHVVDNDLSQHFLTHLDLANVPYYCTICNERLISRGAVKRHQDRSHSKMDWKVHWNYVNVSSNPISNFRSGFREIGTTLENLQNKCSKGAKFAHRHYDSVNFGRTPLAQVEEEHYINKIAGMVQNYSDLALLIARGENGMTRFNLLDLAEQHGRQLEEIANEFKRMEGK